MFGSRRRPKCPITTREKVWIEQRFRWLAGAFGPRRMLGAHVIEPTPEYFPDPYDESTKAVDVLFCRVCEYMGLRRDRFQLHFMDEPHGNLGEYIRSDPEQIRLNEKIFDQPMQLAATCAHELAHALLLGDDRISDKSIDHEPVTDLLMVFTGFGVIAANSAIQERRGYPYRLGYLLEREMAYALALFVWLRGEQSPPWLKSLRPNVLHIFDDAKAYLEDAGECLYSPIEFANQLGPVHALQEAEIVAALESDAASRRLFGLWELQRSGESVDHLMDRIVRLILDPDPEIREADAEALGFTRLHSSTACAALCVAAKKEQIGAVRRAIAWALGRLPESATERIKSLFGLLRDQSVEVREAAADALESCTDNLGLTHVEKLVGAVRAEPSPDVRHAILNVIAELPVASIRHVFPHLLELLDDREREMNADVLRSLTRLGAEAAPALPSIEILIRRGDPIGRAIAAGAVAKIAGDLAGAIQVLRHTHPLPIIGNEISFKRFETATMRAVQSILRDIGVSACEHLVSEIRANTLGRQAFAAWALGQIGELPEYARSELVTLLSHETPLVRLLAATSFGCLDGPNDPAVPVWLKLLEHRPPPKHNPADADQCLGRAAGEILLVIGQPLVPAVFDRLRLDHAAGSKALIVWLGEFASRDAEVDLRLKQELADASEPLRSRLEIAIKERTRISREADREPALSLSYPPPLEPPTELPDPIDAAQESMWQWLAYWDSQNNSGTAEKVGQET